MKKSLYILFLLALLAHGFVGAQVSMTVPHGSFEQWTSHSGYSVTVVFIPMSVYSSYSTPTGWDYLSYPVNESVSGITINTNLPLIKASQETGAVPDSNSAVKLQTFMLSDIISSTVYSMAAGSIDTMLTNMVFPSILSTGAMDIDHFIPIMSNLMSNMDSMEALLTSLAEEDVNYYFDGGLSLNGFEPTRLTGSYKYHSAVSGDNGGVFILGTHYNSTLHKRQVVGGGVNIDLTDCTNYTPFTVNYMSLHEYDASFAEQDPDSLIIMLISSASLNRQQGSWLCVESLVLWHDTCADITIFTANSSIHEAVLNWSCNGAVSTYEMECGPAGFVLGSGTRVTLTDTTFAFSGLPASTQFDIYLRTVCSDNIYGDWSFLSFTTFPDTCTRVLDLEVNPTPDNPGEYDLSWSGYSDPWAWQVEYGPRGFVQGTGTVLTLEEPGLNLSLLNLLSDSWYDFYVRSMCGYNLFGVWSMVQFHTDPDTCAGIVDIVVVPDIHEVTASWSATGPVEGYEFMCASNTHGDQFYFDTILYEPTFTVTGLESDSGYWVGVRSFCSDSIYGEWSFASFFTLVDTTSTEAIFSPSTNGLVPLVSPNPAKDRLTVDCRGVHITAVEVYDIHWKLVLETKSQTIDVSSLPSGVYFLRVKTDDGRAATTKFVKE